MPWCFDEMRKKIPMCYTLYVVWVSEAICSSVNTTFLFFCLGVHTLYNALHNVHALGPIQWTQCHQTSTCVGVVASRRHYLMLNSCIFNKCARLSLLCLTIQSSKFKSWNGLGNRFFKSPASELQSHPSRKQHTIA